MKSSIPLVLLTAAALAGCRAAATSVMASVAAAGGSSYAADDDPELVEVASPFGLKTMESLVEERPHHEELLTALARDFTKYTWAFVQSKAEAAEIEGRASEARAGRERARSLFLRARDYGLRALEERKAGLAAKLRGVREAPAALASLRDRDDVPPLYWTALAWMLAISNGRDRMDLVAQIPAPEAMMARALALDEAWDEGAIHEFYVSYDATRSEAQGGGPARARQHLERALALSGGAKLGPLVSFAEGVCVQTQDRAEFTRILNRVLSADVDGARRHRLANVLAQRRARLLLAHVDDLFL